VTSKSNENVLLDAALQSVMAVGVRRTTLTDVARLADVSRMTLYRYFPDLAAVLRALMTREFSTLMAEIGEEVAALPTARDRLVESAVTCIERLPRHPLFQRVLDVDPDLILPYVIDRLGTTQRSAIAVFGRLLAEGRADGSIDVGVGVGDGDGGQEDRVAYCLQVALQSFVFSARVTEKEYSVSAVSGELRRMLNAYLAPGLNSAGSPAGWQLQVDSAF
jgi:AcrR family transcriptional regulator